MRAAVKLIEEKKIDVRKVVSHILGLDAAAHTTLNLPQIIGGKKMVYTQKALPLISLNTLLQEEPETDFLRQLKQLLVASGGLWSKQAEDFVLKNAPGI